MPSSATERIKLLVADLDAAVPRDGALVQLSQYGSVPEECKIVANQRGYLRLGIEFLRAAFAPPSPKSKELVEVDLRYLLTVDSTVGFDWFERREDLTAAAQAESKPSRIVPALITLVLLACLILAIVGLGTVISWMSG